MNRLEATKQLMSSLDREPVIASLGHPAYDLFAAGDRRENFYTWGSMGLASSIGLGLAMARPDLRVFVVDGDGSLLMNLGTLSTMARYRPGNLVHIVFDNASLLSVGGFPTATATGTDLAGVARACAIPEVVEAHTPERLKQAVAGALAGGMLTTIVSKVEAIGPKSFHMDLPLLENRFQFKRALEALR
jgi:sulfopyruvate decarboxylase subunit beta